MSQPFPEFFHKLFHLSNSEIIYPPSYNLVYPFNCNCKWSRYCFSSFQIFAQLLFQFPLLFIRWSDFPFRTILKKCEYKVLTSCRSDYFCLRSVYFQKQFSFQLTTYRFHYSVCCHFTLREYQQASRPRELPPKSLSEPYVNFSAHTVPIIQPMTVFQISSVQTDSYHVLLSLLTNVPLFFLSFDSYISF